APARGAAAPASAGRRQQREPDRVVRVQIGRVEVRAAGQTPPAARRTRQPARPAPALDLEKYLNRGRS
ncbi:hypothetical protein ACFRMQ_34525, partial [Kitasatospora sp. NPDC056783]|uniref:hypothetical protein n=1 Tax=Kitasatospora sp. NPDC056783 TaxID=3345943 RepID=UPI0036AFB2A1